MKEFLRRRRWAAALSLTTALAVTGFLGLRAATMNGGNPPANVKTVEYSEAAAGHGYANMLKQVVPAVVNISSSRVIKPTANSMRGMEGVDPFFRQFFGDNFFRNMVPQERREKSLGSGVIVSPNGYILTNNHVIDHATDITVTLNDKRELKAKVIGTDSRTDIAVLKVDGTNFPTLTLGDSNKVEVGDVVLAIGDPFGVGETVTNGIVSAKGRGGLGIEEVEDFIQTDAPINPGNSGGALIDDQGHLIAINTAILSGNSGGNQGIGFAIPVNMARHDMDEILKTGKVERGYLGILPQDVTPAIAKAFNTTALTGALVGDVTAGSPAAKAGLQKGDIIVSVNGTNMADANQLRLMIGQMAPNEAAHLKVMRNGKPLEITVNLGSFPSTEEHASANTAEPNNVLDGVSVENLTPDTAQQLKLAPSTKGVVVDQVSPASKAAEAGLQQGDVIQEVNHHAVTNVDEFKQAVSAGKGSETLLLVNRGGMTMYLAI